MPEAPDAPSGKPIIGYGQILLEVWFTGDPDNPESEVKINALENMPFAYIMVACENFIRATAQQSGKGYEEAVDLLVEGAMKSRGGPPKDGGRPKTS